MKNFADIHAHMSNIDFKTCEDYLNLIKEQGITHLCLQSLTYRWAIYNLVVLYWKKYYKDMKMYAFGMIHNQDIYKDIPYEEQAKEIIKMGFDGIKLMFDPNTRKKLGHGMNDARYEKMFAYLEENEIPLVIHVNDPDYFWVVRQLTEEEITRGWGYFTEGYLTKQEMYDEAFEVLDRHPKLKVTFAHFFYLSSSIDEAARVLDKYPNVTYDLTPGQVMFDDFSKDIDAWKAFFVKYSDRIFYGTDTNSLKNNNVEIHRLIREAISHDKSEFEIKCYQTQKIRGLDLDDETKQKICFDNFYLLLGEPKEVNTTLMCEHGKRIMQDINLFGEDKIDAMKNWLEEFFRRELR